MIENRKSSSTASLLLLWLLVLQSKTLCSNYHVFLLVLIYYPCQRHEALIHILIVLHGSREIPQLGKMYLILFLRHHSLIQLSLTRFSRSLLLPTSMIIALSAFVLHRSYHCYLIFLKELSRERSNTMSTPWQPLKQVETIDRYFSWPAVSQMYSLAGLSLSVIFLILKSMVVTWVSFSAKKSPSVNLQKSAVLPTLLSPTIIILYLFSSLLLLRQRSYIILIIRNNNPYSTIKPSPTPSFLFTQRNYLDQKEALLKIILFIQQFLKMSNHKLAMLHIKKQYELAQKCESDLSISVGLEDEDLFKWRVCFQGPENTPFEGGLYEATLRFPVEFPYQPPKMVFKTEMFHPNIYPTGEVCISILHPPVEDPLNPQQKLSEKWNPVLTIEAVLISVTSMLVDPNLDSPANVDAAKLMKENRKEYDRKLRFLARKSIGDV